MAKKQMLFKTKGMNRDLSVSAFNPEFAFENMNLRLSTNEGNTLMSWVNERGTAQLGLNKEDHHWYKDGKEDVEGEKTSEIARTLELCADIDDAIANDWIWTEPEEESPGTWSKDDVVYEVDEGETQESVAEILPKYLTVAEAEAGGWGWSKYSNTSIEGTPIGTAVLNHKLVLFTTEGATEDDHIYTIEYINSNKTQLLVTEKYGQNIGLDENHPIETLVSYESEMIQKVYWVDGKNQPRVINIVADNISDKPDTYFDFIPTLQLKENITVEKMLGASGTFAPGVIQYAFTYYNKYGQESNIFYTTPLLYVSHGERGTSPEDKVENAFRITIEHPDTNFDYIRIYSIQRTSIDGTPIVKRIQDITLEEYSEEQEIINIDYASNETLPTVYRNEQVVSDLASGCQFTRDRMFGIPVTCYGFIKSASYSFKVVTSDYSITYGEEADMNSVIWITSSKITYGGIIAYYIIETKTPSGNSPMEAMSASSYILTPISFIDTGLVGDSVDPTELLYKGGESIIANTIEQKDNTLFLGSIKLARKNLFKDEIGNVPLKDSIKNDLLSAIQESSRSFWANSVSEKTYVYASQLTSYKDVEGYKSSFSVPCGGFKRGENYRLGVQFQHKTGKWSEPIFVGDYTMSDNAKPSVGNTNNTMNKITVPTIISTISSQTVDAVISRDYLKARAVVVFPKAQDRKVICQGVVNPTIYTDKERNTDKNLYAQSSWFFRPLGANTKDGDVSSTGAVYPWSKPYSIDDSTLPYTSRQVTGSLPVSEGIIYNPELIKQVEVQGEFDPERRFAIDRSLLTMHSPEIEFNNQIYSIGFDNVTPYAVGEVIFKNTMSDIDIQTESPSISNNGGGFVHKSFIEDKSFGIVSGLFYDDYVVDDKNADNIMAWDAQRSSCKWMVYAWNRTGSLNNDIKRPSGKGTPSAVLKKKILSNLRITNTEYTSSTLETVTGKPQLFSSDESEIIKLNLSGNDNNPIYKGNIDTALIPDYADGLYFAFDDTPEKDTPAEDGVKTDFTCDVKWKTYSKSADQANDEGLWKYQIVDNQYKWKDEVNQMGETYLDLVMKKDSVRMKYKSTPHIVLPANINIQSWNENKLPIVELRRDPVLPFGGDSMDALAENTWIPCGEPVKLTANTAATIKWEYGDTYYQRWDCLKTYAFTREDINQIIEIGSFMLETHINIDGRYDRNRGQMNNLNMSPQNFNLINSVYSQQDNFFSYKILPKDYYVNINFPNQVTWSKTKESGADVDLWTNITLASVLELDGDKGYLNKLIRFNNYLFAFQDKGISQILYNDNVQVQSTQGVPIEIANSGKVSGKDYKSSSIGCSNKWSMVTTPNGIYFMDSNDKSIYLFNGQLANISNAGGFNSWCKLNIPSAEARWTPVPYEKNQQGVNVGGFENFVGYYDKLNQDVLYINHKTALAWSEKMQAFTSFYDYGNTPFFVNLDDTGIWISKDLINQDYKLWRHQTGNYCSFFGINKPYWMTLVGNSEPQMDKIFTNLEFRACIDIQNEGDDAQVPFDRLETWNEYQHGIANIDIRKGHSLFKHHLISTTDFAASLIRKFRIWRCDIPRDNTPKTADQTINDNYTLDSDLGIFRYDNKPVDRMRNPWLYLKLFHSEPSTSTLKRTEIHDIVMTYFT